METKHSELKKQLRCIRKYRIHKIEIKHEKYGSGFILLQIVIKKISIESFTAGRIKV